MVLSPLGKRERKDVSPMPLFKIDLFKSKIEPRCGYCIHSRPLDEGQVICPKKGVMSQGSSCRRFTYDPMKRVPPRPVKADFSGLTDDDFSLD